jgi:lipopolysaccharide biosynthesis protein
MVKIGICIHVFVLDLFPEFLEYIRSVSSVFEDVTTIFTLNDSESYREFARTTLLPALPHCHILYIDNKGVDVYAFFEQIRYMRANAICVDFILKLHTKTTNIDGRFDNWRQDLIVPIVDRHNLPRIKQYMVESKDGQSLSRTKRLGHISAQKCMLPRMYDLDFKNNLLGILLLTRIFPNITENYLDFTAGTMFWINQEIIDEFMTDEFMDFMEQFFKSSKPENNLDFDKIQTEYVFERLITGSFCTEYKNILIRVSPEGEDQFISGCPIEIMKNFFPQEINNLQNMIR